jgi:hypothetical protein
VSADTADWGLTARNVQIADLFFDDGFKEFVDLNGCHERS